MNKPKKKKKAESLLKTDKRALGSNIKILTLNFNIVFDRFFDPTNPSQRDVRIRATTPGVGSYFRFKAPLGVQGKGGVKLIYAKDSLI